MTRKESYGNEQDAVDVQIEYERALRDQLELLAASSQREHRVLIVEDDQSISDKIINSLKLDGFKCVQANDGASGLERMEQYSDVTIVVADGDMSDMSGLEMAQAMDKQFSDRRYAVIILADKGGVEKMITLNRVEVFEFLPKPLSFPHLSHVVRLAREVTDLQVYERSLKEFLIEEGARRSRQIQRLKQENQEMKERVGFSNEAERRTLHVRNLMDENKNLKEQIGILTAGVTRAKV